MKVPLGIGINARGTRCTCNWCGYMNFGNGKGNRALGVNLEKVVVVSAGESSPLSSPYQCVSQAAVIRHHIDSLGC